MTGSVQYKKSWLIITMIARDLICYEEGDRLPTVQEYTEQFQSSRGIVQNALGLLQREGAVVVEKRGKIGSFILQLDREKLFELGDLQYITGSMAAPLNLHFAALATGICETMADCPATFNFAFMHSSQNRAKALRRAVYDFAIVSLHSAKQLVGRYEELELVMTLQDSLYAPPFQLVSNLPSMTELPEGATIAADPNSNDQYDVTRQLCEGKKVNLVEAPYLSTVTMLRAREAHFAALRINESHAAAASVIPIDSEQNREMTVPAVIVNRRNYGIGRILQRYLDQAVIAHTQTAVMEGRKEAQFY